MNRSEPEQQAKQGPNADAARVPDDFVDVPLQPKFFQASSFFPMPVVLIATRGADGETNLAPYSLLFPHMGDDLHTLTLVCRATSNTARNIQRDGRCSINFITDEHENIEGCKALGQPGTTAEKMGRNVFPLGPSPWRKGGPEVVTSAVQIFDCLWLDSYPISGHLPGDLTFVFRVEHIAMTAHWHDSLVHGHGHPPLAVDFGFRSPSGRWLTRSRAVSYLPQLRPKFSVDVPYDVATTEARIRHAIRGSRRLEARWANNHVRLAFVPSHKQFWTPQLEIDILPGENGIGAQVFGRLGPDPSVWTLFMGMHMLVGLSGLGGLMLGISQSLSDAGTAWGYWLVPVAIFLHFFIIGAAFIGQGIGADQTYRLRTFVDDTLAS